MEVDVCARDMARADEIDIVACDVVRVSFDLCMF